MGDDTGVMRLIEIRTICPYHTVVMHSLTGHLHNFLPEIARARKHTMEQYVFGEKLREFRTDAQLTQEELAERIGYSRNRVVDWENGNYKNPPKRGVVLKIAETLKLGGYDQNELLRAAGYEPILLDDDFQEELLTPAGLSKAVERGVGKAFDRQESAPPQPIPTRIPAPRAEQFVGRKKEKAWLRQRLLAGEKAAVAGVRGIGGIGKTELAIAVVQELGEHFPGEIIWLDCGPNDGFVIQERLAQAVGAQLTTNDLDSRADALALAMSKRPATLVVFDDIRRRHLADLEDLLPPSPPCAVLITSRRHDLPLPRQAVRRIDVLEPAEGEGLLEDLLRAEGVPTNGEEVAAIARLLEYVPLALTLAARHAAAIIEWELESEQPPLALLRQELETRRRIRVLHEGERPDLSVVITFDASYDDLDPAHQTHLAQLGVFAQNDLNLAAVKAVWNAGDEESTRAGLHALTHAGLVETTGPETWWLHDLLREYAAEKLLADNSLAVTTRIAHARFCHTFLEQLELREAADWEQLSNFIPEVEQAADWLLADWQKEPQLSAELAIEISQTLQSYTVANWETWLRQGMAAAQADGQKNSARRLQRSLGEYYQWRGEPAQAEMYIRSSLATAQALLDEATKTDDEEGIDNGRRGVAVTQSSLADLLTTRGQVEEAERLYRESLQTKKAIGDTREVAVTQVGLADLMALKGDVKEAEAVYISCLEIFRRLQDAYSFGAVQTRLALLYLQQKRREEAAQLLHAARQLFTDLRAPQWVAAIDKMLPQAHDSHLALDKLIWMVRAARGGDHAQGKQAWELCQQLTGHADPETRAVANGLIRVLAGDEPDKALAALPESVREQIMAALQV